MIKKLKKHLNRKTKLVVNSWFVLVICVVSASTVFGLGLAPASRVVEFSPNSELVFQGLLINNEDYAVNVSLSKEDPFGVLFVESSFVEVPSKSQISFSYKIVFGSLNKKLSGVVGKVVANQVFLGNGFSATVVLESIVEVRGDTQKSVGFVGVENNSSFGGSSKIVDVAVSIDEVNSSSEKVVDSTKNKKGKTELLGTNKQNSLRGRGWLGYFARSLSVKQKFVLFILFLVASFLIARIWIAKKNTM